MSGLESAIRTALGSAERDNPEVRARIYQSARQALEAGLRKQDITDPDAVAHHRHRLETTIHAIEAEERARQAPPSPSPATGVTVPPEAVMPEPVPRPQPAAERREEPSMDLDMPASGPARRSVSRDEPVFEEASDAGLEAPRLDEPMAAPSRRGASASAVLKGDEPMGFRPEPAVARRKPRKFFSRLLLWCVLLAFVGVGGWWVATSGILMDAAQRDRSVANPPATTQPEDYQEEDEAADSNGGVASPAPQAQNNFSAAWISIFDPSKAASLQTGAQASVEPVKNPAGDALRLVSKSPGPDGNIGIEIPADVLQQLAGKTSTIALTLQSASDQSAAMVVECEFQTLGNCARHRFTVTTAKQEALIKLRFDRTMAPSSPGRLVINSDLDGRARGINLYAVRILPGE